MTEPTTPPFPSTEDWQFIVVALQTLQIAQTPIRQDRLLEVTERIRHWLPVLASAEQTAKESHKWMIEFGMKCKSLEATKEELAQARAEIEALRGALAALSYRHEWHPGIGPCVCEAHIKARALLAAGEGTPTP